MPPRSRSRGRQPAKSVSDKSSKPGTKTTSATSTSRSPATAPSPPHRRRLGTIYDAVAGRLTQHGFANQPSAIYPSHYRDIPASESKILRSDEALLRAARAPERYEEDDYYARHRHLVSTEREAEAQRRFIEYANGCDVGMRGFEGKRYEALQVGMLQRHGRRWSEDEVQELKGRVKVGKLPDGELCASVHEFASLFYGVCGGTGDWRSLDETALLAVGVLLEETVREAMGETGWMAFVEGDVMEGEDVVRPASKQGVRDRKMKERSKMSDSEGEISGGFVRDGEDTVREHVAKPKRKRRKISAEEAGLGDDW